MTQFIMDLLHINFFLFDKVDNFLVFTLAFVVFWCFVWLVLKRIFFKRF